MRIPSLTLLIAVLVWTVGCASAADPESVVVEGILLGKSGYESDPRRTGQYRTPSQAALDRPVNVRQILVAAPILPIGEISGEWIGTVTNAFFGEGVLEMNLQEDSEGQMSGLVTVVFGDSTQVWDILTGSRHSRKYITLDMDHVFMELQDQADPTVSTSLVGEILSSSKMEGNHIVQTVDRIQLFVWEITRVE